MFPREQAGTNILRPPEKLCERHSGTRSASSTVTLVCVRLKKKPPSLRTRRRIACRCGCSHEDEVARCQVCHSHAIKKNHAGGTEIDDGSLLSPLKRMREHVGKRGIARSRIHEVDCVFGATCRKIENEFEIRGRGRL